MVKINQTYLGKSHNSFLGNTQTPGLITNGQLIKHIPYTLFARVYESQS